MAITNPTNVVSRPIEQSFESSFSRSFRSFLGRPKERAHSSKSQRFCGSAGTKVDALTEPLVAHIRTYRGDRERTSLKGPKGLHRPLRPNPPLQRAARLHPRP